MTRAGSSYGEFKRNPCAETCPGAARESVYCASNPSIFEPRRKSHLEELATSLSSEQILDLLPRFEKVAEEIKATLLTNLIMIGEVASPTFGEAQRVEFLCNRFTESHLTNCSADEMGNGFGILPGTVGEANLLVVAHTDTVFSDGVDHTILVTPDSTTGPGLGDNSLGVAVLATLPILLEKLEIRLRNDVILMGAARSLGRGDLEGIRFFLANNRRPIKAGICVEGVPLGRLSYKSIGMIRCELTCTVPDEYDWTRFGVTSAIINLNQVINRINEIPRPQSPRTSIIMGSIESGSSFGTLATNGTLRFEIRSESSEHVHDIWRQIESIASEVSSETGAEITLNVYARREPGGIKFAHPLVDSARGIMNALSITPRIVPSTSELSALIDHEIPGLTLGLARGQRHHQVDENLSIRTMFTGIAQLVGVLLSIDGGLCDES